MVFPVAPPSPSCPGSKVIVEADPRPGAGWGGWLLGASGTLPHQCVPSCLRITRMPLCCHCTQSTSFWLLSLYPIHVPLAAVTLPNPRTFGCYHCTQSTYLWLLSLYPICLWLLNSKIGLEQCLALGPLSPSFYYPSNPQFCVWFPCLGSHSCRRTLRRLKGAAADDSAAAAAPPPKYVPPHRLGAPSGNVPFSVPLSDSPCGCHQAKDVCPPCTSLLGPPLCAPPTHCPFQGTQYSLSLLARCPFQEILGPLQTLQEKKGGPGGRGRGGRGGREREGGVLV